MNDSVAEVKQKTDIVEVIGKFVPLKRRGRHFIACCPFHQEKSPSFIVSPELQIFKCFGCGKAGDVFTFVQEYEKIDFKEALEELAARAGIKLEKYTGVEKTESLKKRLFLLNQTLSRIYNQLLTKNAVGKSALSYLESRGITPEIIQEFSLGFSPPKSSSVASYLLTHGFTQAELVASGNFSNSSYTATPYDRFGGRLIFPLSDHRDRIIGFSGRVLPGADANQAKYINSPETELYHKSYTLFGLNKAKEYIRTQNQVIVVEGEFDMISPYQSGIKNIVAIKGTAFTEEQLQLLKRYTDNIVLSLDADFAGNTAALRSLQLADNNGFDIRVLALPPEFKDPDEAVKKDPAIFKLAVEKAKPLWDFVINFAIQTHGVDTPKAKREVLASTLPFIGKIENSVIRGDYLKKLALELSTEEQLIQEELVRLGLLQKKSSPTATTAFVPPQNTNPVSSSREYALLELIIAAKSPSAVAKNALSRLSVLTHPGLDKIYQQLALGYTEPATFRSQLPAEVAPLFDELYLTKDNQELDSKTRAKQISGILDYLETQNIKSRMLQISKEIALLESHDADTADLSQEHQLLTNRLKQLQKPQ